LPSITPAYLYTFIALLAVSTILVFSFMAYADTLRAVSETKQLKNLMDYVGAKATELLTLTITRNTTAETYLQMPTTIGTQQYWLQLHNDSSQAWVDGGFGNTPVTETELHVYLPREASATGFYVGGYGAAHLKCNASAAFPQIQLTSSSGGT